MREVTLWSLHLLAGIIVLVFLGIHMRVMHLDAIMGVKEPTSWGAVLSRGKGFLFPFIYLVILAAGLYHGLYGLRNILLELEGLRRVGKPLGWIIFLAGLALFLYGAYIVIAASSVS